MQIYPLSQVKICSVVKIVSQKNSASVCYSQALPHYELVYLLSGHGNVHFCGKDGVDAPGIVKPQNNLITFECRHSNSNFESVLEYGMRGYLRRIDKSFAVHADNLQKQYFLMVLSIACDASRNGRINALVNALLVRTWNKIPHVRRNCVRWRRH